MLPTYAYYYTRLEPTHDLNRCDVRRVALVAAHVVSPLSSDNGQPHCLFLFKSQEKTARENVVDHGYLFLHCLVSRNYQLINCGELTLEADG